MKRSLSIRSVAAFGALLLLVGCGPKEPPKTAKDVKSGEVDLTAPPAQPKRNLSGEAKGDFKKALGRYRQEAKTGVNKTNCADLAGAFGDVYADFPNVVEAKFNEGVIWEKCGEKGKAEEVYQAILRKHPNHGPTLNNLGQMLYEKGQSGAALSYFQKAAAAKNSEGYVNLAMIQRDRALRGDTESLREAVNNIHRALAVDSFNIEAYNTLATLIYDHARSKSKLEMARLICLQAIKQRPDFAPVYNVLGLVLLKMGRVTPALAEFRKAAERDANLVDAQMNIAAVTLSFRDYTSAEEAYRRVLSLNPSKKVRYSATVGLGVALRGQRKFDQAMAQYKAAEKIDSSNADIYYNMGILVQDYTFDAANPGKGIGQLREASGYLNRYLSAARDKTQVEDARRRIKNINEMIPMLQEQQRMMSQSGQ